MKFFLFGFFCFFATAEAQPSAAAPSAVHQVPAYCTKATLNGLEFMQLIRKVIEHGDLADVAFLQKSFDNKFHFSSGANADGKLDDRIEKYSSSLLRGNPTRIELIHRDSSALRSEGDWISLLEFSKLPDKPTTDAGPNFIADCLHMTMSKFSAYFGGGGWIGVPTDGAPFAVYRDLAVTKAKTGSVIDVSFDFNRYDDIVTSITIGQSLRQSSGAGKKGKTHPIIPD